MSEKADLSFGEGEDEVISNLANKLGFWGGRRGRLVLTSRRLVFTHHRDRKIRAEYPLSDIIHVSKSPGTTIWNVVWPFLAIGIGIGFPPLLLLVLPIVVLAIVFLRPAIKVTFKGGHAQRFWLGYGRTVSNWVSLINEYKGQRQSGVAAGSASAAE